MTPARIGLIVFAVIATIALFAMPQLLVADAERPAAPQQAMTDGYAPNAETIGPVVRRYLLDNPEILREMAQALQTRDAETANAARAGVFEEHRARIYDSPDQIVMGNPQGDVTLVEFFDYNCGFCRRAVDDLDALIEADGKLKVVLKELPVLGEGSVEAARVSVAVNRVAPDLYPEFHRTLLKSQSQADGASALEAAAALGIDRDKLAAALADPAVDAAISEAHELAELLGIDGTPTYVIADTVVPGALGEERLRALVANARACGRADCS